MESPIEIEAPNEVESDYEDSTNDFYNTASNNAVKK